MGDLKVHVIYEYGTDMRPHSSAYIRLLQPLGHPTNHDSLQLTYDIDYFGTAVDVVIIDRLWRPDCSYELAENLLQRIRRAGAKIIYTVDDNFYGLKVGATTGFQKDYLSITGILLRQADAVIVSTYQLQHLFLDDNAHIAVVPNALDERLIVSRYPSSPGKFIPKPRVIIGYMGTFTHDDDFLMILPALESIARRHPGEIEFQIVCAFRSEQTKKSLAQLPVRYFSPKPDEMEYPLFMLWWTTHLHWDIGLAPLQDTEFTSYKSDIKFLDYAAIGVPGIYSNTPAYRDTVENKSNGLLVENNASVWEDAIETMLTHPELRHTMAKNAQRYLYSERVLAYRAKDWVAAIQTLLN